MIGGPDTTRPSEQGRSIKEIVHTLSVSRTTVRKVTAICKDCGSEPVAE
jgi:hypothetical protein